MNHMEDVVKFLNSYLDVEYAGATAVYSDSDEVVNEHRDESMKFWHAVPGVILSPSFGRPMGMPQEQFAKLGANSDLARRALFLVAEYADQNWGTLYAGYIGGDRNISAQSYGGLLYVTEIKRKLKIIASYKEDFDQPSPPIHWRHSQGVEIVTLENPSAVRPIEEPTGRVAHLQDWEALLTAATDR
ncbi:hypothetical protein AB0L80_04885 [Streptomyces sp. NPDC052069]|uniref:hypothetical protein n=1 Tax=Streptomyces sp. NPDC052069 TaxID=3154650 RepID=UPI0034481C58